MAALLNLYFAPHARVPAVKRLTELLAIEFAELARRVRGSVAEILVFLWATLALGVFGLVAAGFLVASEGARGL
jgi:uncharacterized membrane-anchored protein